MSSRIEWKDLSKDMIYVFRFSFFQKKQLQKKVRFILSKCVGQQITPDDYVFNPHGKPCLKDFPNIQFNVSHTDQEAMFAVGWEDAIGIDIEKIKKMSILRLSKRFFSADEFYDLERLEENKRDPVFFQYWTLKEAYAKAQGISVWQVLSLNCMSVGRSALFRWEKMDANFYRVMLFSPPGYVSTLVCAQMKPVHFIKWE